MVIRRYLDVGLAQERLVGAAVTRLHPAHLLG